MINTEKIKQIFYLILVFLIHIEMSIATTFSSNSFSGNISNNDFKIESINFPKYFFTNQLDASCKMWGQNNDESFKKSKLLSLDLGIKENQKYLKDFVNYNWTKDHNDRSDSLSVNLEPISNRLSLIHGSIVNSLIENTYSEQAFLLSEILTLWAQSKIMLDVINAPEIISLKSGTSGKKCYEGGNVKAKCTWHTSQEAARYSGQYIINSILIKKILSPEQLKIINAYIDNLYDRHISTWTKNARKSDSYGFNQMADGGISVLAYSHWKKDKSLAKSEFSNGFNKINSVWYEDGYINNNSFRGVRDIWYHSLGVNNVLGYIALAHEWGVKVPDNIQDKINASVKVHKLGIENLEKYRERKFTGYKGNSSSDINDAIEHTHHEAPFIDWLELNYTNIQDVSFLKKDKDWQRKRKQVHTDRMLGFNPRCIKK